MMRTIWTVWVTFVATACAATPAEQPVRPQAPPRPKAAAAPRPTLSGPPAMAAHVLAELPNVEQPIWLARRDDDGVLVVQQDGRWWSTRISYRTRPLAAGRPEADTSSRPKPAQGTSQPALPEGEAAHDGLVELAPAPEGTAVAAVAAVDEGYALAWLAPADGATELRAMTLDADGRAKGPVTVVTRSTDELRWIEWLPTSRGALLLWELATATGRELRVEAWPTASAGAGRQVATRCLGWQAVATPSGAAIAAVTGEGANQATLGRAALWRVETDATVREPIELSTSGTAVPDVQLAWAKDRIMVAWTDLRPLPKLPQEGAVDPRVHVAAVGADGSVLVAPRVIDAPAGDHALVGLSADSSSGRTALAWEPLLPTSTGRRTIHVQWLDADARSDGAQSLVDFAMATDAPQMSAATTGLGVLTLAEARTVAATDESGASLALGVVPTFVWLDASLRVVSSEPVRIAQLGEPGTPTLVRSLRCVASKCDAVAVGGTDPSLLTIVAPARAANGWASVARRSAPQEGGQSQALSTVAHADGTIVDVASARIADGRELVAWLEQPPAEQDATASRPARLAYRLVSADGELGPTVVLSEKAIAVGGLDVAAVDGDPGTKRRGRAAAVIGWAGPNNNAPQVFATAIGWDGGKLAQKAITSHRGGSQPAAIADVAITSDAAGGLVLAWSDTSDGNPEIHAVRIDQRLTRTSPERRLTDAPGASTEPHVAVHGDKAYLVWSDAREAAETGVADVYVALLDAKSLEKRGAEQRLFHSSTHSRSPSVTSSSEGPVVWWIEDAVPGATDTTVGLRVMRLGSSAEPLASPLAVRPPRPADVRAATVGCGGSSCRVLLGWLEDAAYVVGSAPLPGVAALAPTTAGPKAPVTPLAEWAAPAFDDAPFGRLDPTLGVLYVAAGRQGPGTAVKRLVVGWP